MSKPTLPQDAEQERAAIVEWLRTEAVIQFVEDSHASDIPRILAYVIERGDHITPESE